MKTLIPIKALSAIAKASMISSVLIMLCTACSHEQTNAGKDDGTGTIMDDGTSNRRIISKDTATATPDASMDTINR